MSKVNRTMQRQAREIAAQGKTSYQAALLFLQEQSTERRHDLQSTYRFGNFANQTADDFIRQTVANDNITEVLLASGWEFDGVWKLAGEIQQHAQRYNAWRRECERIKAQDRHTIIAQHDSRANDFIRQTVADNNIAEVLFQHGWSFDGVWSLPGEIQQHVHMHNAWRRECERIKAQHTEMCVTR